MNKHTNHLSQSNSVTCTTVINAKNKDQRVRKKVKKDHSGRDIKLENLWPNN
jgi:hypothetical protein